MVAREKKKKVVVLNKDSNSPSKKTTNKINPIKPVPKKNKKDTKKKTEVKKDSKEKDLKKLKTVKNPYKDKLFQVTLKQVSTNAKTVQEHPEVDKKQEEIKEASFLSAKEQEKDNDLKEDYSTIDKSTEVKEEKKFSAKKFKGLLKVELDKLEKKLPKSSSAAKKFKRDKPLGDLKDSVNTKVVSSKKDTMGDLESSVKSETGTKSTKAVVEAKPIVKEQELQKPKNIINSKYASPKKKHDTEISMEKESKELDSVMDENNVTNEQLEKSNEKTFLSALDSKKTAKQKAEEAPLVYRKSERSILYKAAKGATNSTDKEFTTMLGNRSQNFDMVHTKQTGSKDINQKKKRDINKKFELIYLDTKTKVNKKLDGLTTYIDKFFEEKGEVSLAKKVFEKNVENKLDDIYGWTTLDDKLFGEDTQAINKVFRDEKKLFIGTLDKIFDRISEHISSALNDSIGIIKKGKDKSKELYDGLSKEDKELAKESYENFTEKYSDLEQKVNDKEKELAQSLASQYKKSVDSLDEAFAAIKKKASSSWIDKAIDSIKGVIDTIKKLGKLISELASELKSFIPKILDDPIWFVKLLFSGVKEGISLFKKNIKTHIITGFIKWLTGALGPMNITLPKNIFSLSGVFSLVMQILGLGWDFIRRKAVKAFGEPVVKVLETSFEMFKIFKKDGVSGIWKYLKEKFNDLKDMVIEEIKSMLITQVIIAGVKWLVGLFVPGGAFIKAIIAIKDLIVTIVESALALIPIIIKSIKALASGNVKGLSKLVEQGLASIIPILIGVLAKILGLGGLSKKVIKIIEKVRKKIDRAVDKLIAKAKKSLKKFFKKGKKGKKPKKDKKQVSKKLDKTLGEEVKFSAGKEEHRLWVKESGSKIDIIVASTPTPIKTRLASWKKKAEKLSDETQKKKALTNITQAEKLTTQTLGEAKEEKILRTAIAKDKLVTKEEYKKLDRADRDVKLKEVKLKNHLVVLFNIFGFDELDFAVTYKTQLDALPLLKDEIISFTKKTKPTKESMENWNNALSFLKQNNFGDKLVKYDKFDKFLRAKSLAVLKSIYPEKDGEKTYKEKLDAIIKKPDATAKDEVSFLANRIAYIREKVKEIVITFYTSKKFTENDLNNPIKEYLKKALSGSASKSEHGKYEPKSTLESVSIVGKKIEITYKYKDPTQSHRTFKVSYDFDKLNTNDKEVTQTSKGENLQLKEAADIEARGKTAATKYFQNEALKQKLQQEITNAQSNVSTLTSEVATINARIKKARSDNDEAKLQTATDELTKAQEKLNRAKNIVANKRAIDYSKFKYEGGLTHEQVREKVEGYKKHEHLFESAHMIADEFLGSGYKQALNLMVTSQEYNRVTMRGAEIDIKKEIISIDAISLFNLDVEATWDYLNDKDILSKLNNNAIFKEISAELKKPEHKENNKVLATSFATTLQNKLLKEDNPRRVLSVQYTGKTTAPSGKNLTKRTIGCDIWMSSYFNFDNAKDKCKYKYKVG